MSRTAIYARAEVMSRFVFRATSGKAFVYQKESLDGGILSAT